MELTSEQSASANVKVKLLLVGGHEYTVFLKSEDPLLYELLQVVWMRSQIQSSGVKQLFQIPLDQGYSLLSFPSEYLVGIVTEPPILIKEVPETKLETSNILSSKYIYLDNFLSLEENQQLLDYVVKCRPNFVPSHTSTQDKDYRQSLVLYEFPEFADLFLNRLHTLIPSALRELGLPTFPISQIEAQLTAHNDGNFYKVHNDNGSPDTATRELTYVYYFFREPKSFSGGELVIYDSKVDHSQYVQANSFKKVEPRNNSIVIFPSFYLHEVLPVYCPSRAFADSRFTINGWVRR